MNWHTRQNIYGAHDDDSSDMGWCKHSSATETHWASCDGFKLKPHDDHTHQASCMMQALHTAVTNSSSRVVNIRNLVNICRLLFSAIKTPLCHAPTCMSPSAEVS
jgi:hypothetical protein